MLWLRFFLFMYMEEKYGTFYVRSISLCFQRICSRESSQMCVRKKRYGFFDTVFALGIVRTWQKMAKKILLAELYYMTSTSTFEKNLFLISYQSHNSCCEKYFEKMGFLLQITDKNEVLLFYWKCRRINIAFFQCHDIISVYALHFIYIFFNLLQRCIEVVSLKIRTKNWAFWPSILWDV